MQQFGFDSTADEVLQGLDLKGTRVVITGASSGLGLETTRSLASKGADVVMLANDEVKLSAARDQLLGLELAGDIDAMVLNLSDLDSVRSAAGKLLSKYPQVNILINNAGIMACPEGRTAQGFERQFGVNYLGHFLFTCLLAPALISVCPSRIVNLSSSAHRMSSLNLDDPNFMSTAYEKWQAYGASKTACALFSVALEKRLNHRGVKSYSVHPGQISTNLGQYFTEEDFALFENPVEPFKTIPQGAATSVWAATSVELADKGGAFLRDCQIAQVDDGPEFSGGVKSYAISPDNAERLWHISEELVGEEFSW